MGKVTLYVVGSWVALQTENITLIDRIKNEFTYDHVTFDYLNSDRYVEKVACYKVQSNGSKYSLIIRRGFLSRLSKVLDKLKVSYDVVEKEAKKSWDDLDVEFLDSLSLRPGQLDCLIAILENRGGIIDAPTGFGKSFLFPILARLFHSASIDIITKRRDVALQIFENLNNSNIIAGLVTTGKKVKKRVTVYTSGSLGYSDFSADIVILDECHELVTPSVLKNLLSYNNALFYGFSASTQTRSDNAWFRLEELCGPIIYKLDYNVLQQAGSVVPIIIQWVPIFSGPPTNSKNVSFAALRRSCIWRNHHRNSKIAAIAKEYRTSGNQVLIITKTIEHALYLHKELPDFIVCCSKMSSDQVAKFKRLGLDAESVNENLSDRTELANRFRSREIMGAIATEVWTTGVSFDDLEVLIRADADVSKTAAIQVPGRVCRLGKNIDKPAGIVVSFADCFNYRFYNRSLALYRFYKKLGWLQCDENLNPIQKFPYSLMTV